MYVKLQHLGKLYSRFIRPLFFFDDPSINGTVHKVLIEHLEIKRPNSFARRDILVMTQYIMSDFSLWLMSPYLNFIVQVNYQAI
jgi:hypothetical protein